MKKMHFCTIPTWTKLTFLHRNSKLVILTRHPNPALIIENMQKHCFFCKSFEQEIMILCQINETNFAYTFLRGSCENGGQRCALGRNKISKQKALILKWIKTVDHPEDIGLLRFNRTRVGGPEPPPSPTLMKYTTRMNLGVGIGYRVVLTSTPTFITSKAGTLVN